MKRISILSFLFLAYGALLAHNFAPHTHHDEVEHRSDSYHDYENGDKGVLNALLAKVVHFPGSADFYSSHNTNSFFKFSIQQFHIPEIEFSISPPIISVSKHPSSFREERIPCFSVTHASLRAPPVA